MASVDFRIKTAVCLTVIKTDVRYWCMRMYSGWNWLGIEWAGLGFSGVLSSGSYFRFTISCVRYLVSSLLTKPAVITAAFYTCIPRIANSNLGQFAAHLN
jgi:hypothetical protein